MTIEKLVKAVEEYKESVLDPNESSSLTMHKRYAMFDALDEYKAAQNPNGPLGTGDQD